MKLTKTGKAVKVLTEALAEDADLFVGYKAMIAMSFYDEWRRNEKKYKNLSDVHNIANVAADNFLKSWIGQPREIIKNELTWYQRFVNGVKEFFDFRFKR